jgi:hypothetical protein
MNIVADAGCPTATLNGRLDGKEFNFCATGDAKRITVSNGMRKLMNNKIWGNIEKTCPDVQPADNNRESVPTDWFMATTANPPAETKPKYRRILRMVHQICLDALAEGANFRSDKVFARETPVLQVKRNILESRDHWDPALSCPRPSNRKRDRSSDDDDSSSDDEDASATASTALVKPNLSLAAAMALVKPFLPPGLAANEQFISFAANQAIYQGMDGPAFARFVIVAREEAKTEREEAKAEREEAKADREEAKAEAKANAERRRIREPDVRAEVEVVFDEAFDVPCGYACGAQISAVHYFVVREGDEFTLCCRSCCLAKAKDGCGTTKRIMKPSRARCWINRHGRNIRGCCHHCGPASRTTMHMLLDGWHAGHDEAKSKGGSTAEGNLAPLHPRCNHDQGVETFEDYNRRQ